MTVKKIIPLAMIIVGAGVTIAALVTIFAKNIDDELPPIHPSQEIHSTEASKAQTFSLRAPEPVPTTVPPTTTTVPEPTTTTEALTEPSRGVSAASVGYSWDDLAGCETGHTYDWATNTGNGYSGGLQFADSTWTNYGGTVYTSEAWAATREQQIEIAEKVLAAEGWNAWPACARELGYL